MNEAAKGIQVAILLPIALAIPSLAAPPPPVDLRFEFAPAHVMLAPGGSADVRVRALDVQGRPLTGALELRALDPVGKVATLRPLTVDAAGWAVFCAAPTPGAAQGIQTFEFRHPAGKARGRYYADLLDPATYEAFQQAAAKVRFERLPAHLLFIGDSLTDLFRGQNYVDKLDFWLSRRFEGKVTVKNVGVGGDTIVRVWDRLNGVAGTYRLPMYEGIFNPRPSHVFFFLGHNDSKLLSASHYRTHAVEPAAFEESYRRAIRKVQAESGAKVIVMSATSSVWEIAEKIAERRRATGKPHTMFGRPDALERFNAIARTVAGQCGAQWLDAYEPTRRHADKPSLFTADGVHVSNLGNRLLALEILKAVGNR